MLFVYPAVFHKENNSYWVEFPDLEGCQTYGDTLNETMGFTSLVSCDVNQYKDAKAIKKTLTIPSWLNDQATSMGINFSQVLQEALLSKIQAR